MGRGKRKRKRRRAMRHLVDLAVETAAAYLAMTLRDMKRRRDEQETDEEPERWPAERHH